jgi:hypothetical protein
MLFDRLTSALLQSSAWVQGQLPLSSSFRESYSGRFEWDKVAAHSASRSIDRGRLLTITQLPAHKHLVWSRCYDDHLCARLQVLMDWQGGSSESNKTVELALVKVEATVPVIDPTYGGAVVLNPGMVSSA